jgi:hypothetical protein
MPVSENIPVQHTIQLARICQYSKNGWFCKKKQYSKNESSVRTVVSAVRTSLRNIRTVRNISTVRTSSFNNISAVRTNFVRKTVQ